MLYIWERHKEKVHSTQGNQVIEQCGKNKNTAPTTWGTDWDYFSTANHIVIVLCPSPCWKHEVSIVTLFPLWFFLQKDILNHRDISYISFFNCNSVYFLIKIYSDSSQIALKYLKDTEVNIGNVLIMFGDFKIRDNSWDPNFPYHFSHSNILFKVADSLHLELSKPTEQVLLQIKDLRVVVATTRRNGTRDMLTSAKLSIGYLVVGITRELDKEPLLHCSSIYINTMWSMLQQCVYLMSYYSSTMLLPQGHHAFTSRLPCHVHVL